MTNYLSNLSDTQRKNIALMDASLTKYGIKNKYIRAGILAIVSKESAFVPKNEISYKNTSASRIKEVFGSRVAGYTNAQLDAIKKDDVKFFNLIYGGSWGARNLGNTQPNDGYNYRGRGFNQLTGRSNYARYKELGILENPDLLNEPKIASEVLALYFKRGLEYSKAKIMEKYGIEDINKVDNLQTATKIAWGINAGSIAKNPTTDVTGGYQMAISRVEDFYDALGQFVKKGGKFIPLLLLIGGGAYYYFRTRKVGLPF
jgi:predicted chitinase